MKLTQAQLVSIFVNLFLRKFKSLDAHLLYRVTFPTISTLLSDCRHGVEEWLHVNGLEPSSVR